MPHYEVSPDSRPAKSDFRNSEFNSFFHDNLSVGINGHGQETMFMRPGILWQWWTKSGGRRIPRALDLQTSITAPVIMDCYLIVFSILVYIGEVHYIETFVSHGYEDSQLPFLGPASTFGSDPLMMEMMSTFCEHQWKFCPVMFSQSMFKKRIDSRQILPIKKSTPIRGRTDSFKSIITSVTLYDDCYDPEWCPTGELVFKQFRTNEDDTLRHAWHRECNALASIGSCPQVVQCLGSFEQSDCCFIMLEHANGGSLLDLFKRNIRPQTATETHRFWMSLMSLLKGTNRIHNLKSRAEEQRTGFAHRDINPGNILVFQDEDDSYSKDLTMKLADFETSTAAQIIDATELGPQDNDGNRTYSAPETSRPFAVQESDLLQLPLHCDIWSLGCVLSDALVWLAGGWEAVQAAGQDRKKATADSHEHLVNGGYGSCFHDGYAVLPCVLASHQSALDRLPTTGGISRQVSTLIERHMLQPSASRAKQSMDIWKKFDKLLRSPIKSLTYSQPWSSPSLAADSPDSPTNDNRSFLSGDGLVTFTSTTTEPSGDQNAPGANMSSNSWEPISSAEPDRACLSASPRPISPQRPVEAPVTSRSMSRSVSVDKSIETKGLPGSQAPSGGCPSQTAPHQHSHAYSKPTSKLFPNKFVSDIVSCRQAGRAREEIPGYEQFKQTMQPRHFMILIDDSKSMREDEEVMDTAENLAWLLKHVDSLGVEVRLASNLSKRYRLNSKSVCSKVLGLQQSTGSFFKPIRELFRGQKGGWGCNMELFLNRIFGEPSVVNSGLPTSVLVLTNGIWEGGAGNGENERGSIDIVVRQMETQNIARTHFTIQFVSFGDDQAGISRLEYIDDSPFVNSRGFEWDIVDHKRHTDNVWEILWGAASAQVDKLS